MTRQIIIVGAGPVGLVTALRLAQFGIPSVILEQSHEMPAELRASTFHPPTLDMLDTLGVTEKIKALGVVTPSWQVLHLESGERAEFPLSVIADETNHPYRLQCEQNKLVEVLFDQVRRSDGIDLYLGAEVLSAEQDDDGVTAVARVGGEQRSFAGAYLVGADGAHSVVRRSIGLPLEGETYPSLTILVTTPFPFEDHIPLLCGANYVWGPVDSFSMFRLRDEWRCTFYPRPGQSEDIQIENTEIQERLRGVVDAADSFPIGERRGYRIHQRIVPAYRAGRIVLAGDAAHLNAPTGGMGMNGGIHDAFNLTEKLRRVWKGESDRLLDVYSDERRPVALDEIIKQAHRNRTRMQERDPSRQMAALRDLQAIASDETRLRDYVRKASMVDGLKKSNMKTLANQAV